ncbi:MAG: tetratricopeptide repeat protein, partial [Muribaculaceae bacterium]|nr:tetratricopeptide repeat protein [Muribaculaceae bacterium]
SQMSAQLSQLKEALAARKLKSSLPEFDQETTRFVRDIYRFFKLFRRKEDFNDPFAAPIDFISLPILGDIIADDEILNLVGEFYFKRGYYKEALPLFLRLESDFDDKHLLWEKIGYCYNALGQLDKALEWYSKAELFHPDSQWLVKKIALCYRLLNRYKDAAEYYLKALERDPENYSLLMNAGHTLLESGNVDEALKHYYHADYVKPDKLSTWRGIAWAELLSGNLKKSLDYYQKIILSPESSATDRLNMGHVYFLLHDYKKAVASYIESARKEGYGLEKLQQAIEEDMPVLVKAGGTPEDLHLILEKVKYDL